MPPDPLDELTKLNWVRYTRDADGMFVNCDDLTAWLARMLTRFDGTPDEVRGAQWAVRFVIEQVESIT